MNSIAIKSLDCGFQLPLLGLGTWGIGGEFKRDRDYDPSVGVAQIEAAIDSGLTLIDTAEAYAEGFTEEIIGQAIRNYQRDKLFIISKIWIENLSYQNVKLSVRKSIKRLGVDYLDMVLPHAPSSSVHLQETMIALNEMVDDGFVRFLGVSNFSKNTFCTAQKYSKHKIYLNQVHYNLSVREPEQNGLLSFVSESDVFLMAWRPIEQGRFEVCDDPILQRLALKYEARKSQIAMSWLSSQDNVICVSRMSIEQHLNENIKAIGLKLKPEEIEELRSNYTHKVDKSSVRKLL